jgi:hypothetical protein
VGSYRISAITNKSNKTNTRIKQTKHIVTCTPIARQRVGKQVPARQILGKQSIPRLRNSR